MANTIDLIKLKRGANSNVQAASLQRGEPAVSLDTKDLWVGDGTGNVKITDVYFYNTFTNLPATGEPDKVYIIKDTGSFYIWDDVGLEYKAYEFDVVSGVTHSRCRMSTNTLIPSSWQSITYPTHDGDTNSAKLEYDGVNQDRIIAHEEGWYRCAYGVVYDIPIVGGGGSSAIDADVFSRLAVNGSNPVLATYNENAYKFESGHQGITDTLTNEAIIYLNPEDYVSVQVQSTGDPCYIQWSDLEIYNVLSAKGDQGLPGTPGSLWHNGSGVPGVGIGNDTDYYLDNDNGDVYYKSGGIWSLTTNSMGTQGPQGLQGEAFQIDNYADFDEAMVTTIEGSGASPTDLYYFLVVNDTRSNQTLPAALNGDMTGHVVMWDGTNWYDFGPFTGIQGPPGADGSGMSDHNEASAEATTQTTNDAFDQKLKMSVTGLTGGTYRIGWYYEWNHNNRNSNFRSRIQVDDTTTVMEQDQEPKDATVNQFGNVGGFVYIPLTSGDHEIDIDWCASSLGDTATIRRARLELWKVG